MSVVHISNHNENIYAIGERIDEAPEVLVEKKYRSRYSAAVKNERKLVKSFRERATMGPAVVAPPDPEQFLRKRNGRQSIPLQGLPKIENRRFSCALITKRPDVPLKNMVLAEQNEKLKHRPKNFISTNIDAVTNTMPKNPTRKIVIDVNGTRVTLSDGLQPRYIYSKKFGSIPKYFKETRHHKNGDSSLKHGSIQENIECIDRDKILAGLKKNWADLQQEFQKLPLLIDTIPKIMRKQNLEDMIRQLEKDILLFERHSHVYVYKDNDEDNMTSRNEKNCSRANST